jgi:tetraacyldisaccharide 4'-kinase
VKLFRNILLPFVPVYFAVTWLRNKLYDLGIFKSKSYKTPIICVGNLSVGGTGKTPMVEYLIDLLKKDFKVAVLSRGYKRKTSGFLLADNTVTADSIGDEPFQFYKKFYDDIIVAVDADRQNGISKLLASKSPEIILLDDAYQHRKVTAGFNILLTTFDSLYIDDWLLPAGNLREPKSGAKRANIVIVTKLPKNLGDFEKQRIKKKLKLDSKQELYFSSISYDNNIVSKAKTTNLNYLDDKKFTLVTGIANSMNLVDYLRNKGLSFEHLNFKDHHKFSQKELVNLNTIENILTTEKDYMRLADKLQKSNVYYLPIKTIIDDSEKFNKAIKKFLTSF